MVFRNATEFVGGADHPPTFQSEFDFAFAHWLVREQLPQNGVRRLPNDPQMAPLKSRLSWQSTTELGAKMRTVGTPVSRAVGEWISEEFDVETPRTESGKVTYTFRYRKVEGAIRFLLGHAGFKDNLVFAPYRLFSSQGEPAVRIYSDMASADWWWETQASIPVDDATVVRPSRRHVDTSTPPGPGAATRAVR